MGLNLGKKGDIGLGVILLVLIILIFMSGWISVSKKECNSNSDCGEDSYCGSDFSCHQIPVIEKTVEKRSLTLPILIICVTIIILAVIWRWEKIFGKKGIGEIKTEKEIPESYYTSQFQYTAK